MSIPTVVTRARPSTTAERFAANGIVFGFVIGLVWLMEAISSLSGGGLSSVLSTSQHLKNHLDLIDVDQASLRTPIMTCLALISWGIAYARHLEIKSRWWGVALAVFIFGGGFVLDGVFEPKAADQVMAARGYARCPSRDHDVGNGKSRIWFADYARSPEICVAKRQRALSGSAQHAR